MLNEYCLAYSKTAGNLPAVHAYNVEKADGFLATAF